MAEPNVQRLDEPDESNPTVHELRLEAISKAYGGVRGVQGISTSFRTGLTGIVGDNGAGKSTIMKIVSGVTTPSSGVLTLDGKELRLTSPIEARQAGIE